MVVTTVKCRAKLLIGDYPFQDQLKKELVPLLRDYPNKFNGKTNVIGKMTEWQWNSESIGVRRLKKYILNEIKTKSPLYMHDGKVWDLYFRDFWGNVYSKGDYAKKHKHLPAVFSMVYFLKSKWYDSPLVFTSFGQKIRPKEGRYVIFPGYLYHHVPKHRYGHKRITLSGNMYYKDVCSSSWYLDGVNNKVSIV